MNSEKLFAYNTFMEEVIEKGQYIARFGLIIGGETKRLKDQKYAVFSEGDISKDPFVPEMLKAMVEFASSRMFHYDNTKVWIFCMASFMIDGELNYTDAVYTASRNDVFLYPFSRDKAEQAKYAHYREWKKGKEVYTSYGIVNEAYERKIKFLEDETRALAQRNAFNMTTWEQYFTEMHANIFDHNKKRPREENDKVPINKEECITVLAKLKRFRNMVPRDDDEKEELAVEISKQKDSDEKNNLLFEVVSFHYMCTNGKVRRENNIDIILFFNPLAQRISEILQAP